MKRIRYMSLWYVFISIIIRYRSTERNPMYLGNGEARPRLGTSISGVLRRFRLTEAMQSRKSCPQVQSRFRSKHKHSDLESHDLESHHGGEYRDPAEYCTWCTCTVVRA